MDDALDEARLLDMGDCSYSEARRLGMESLVLVLDSRLLGMLEED